MHPADSLSVLSRRPTGSAWRCRASLLMLALVSSCGGDGPSRPPEVFRVTVSPGGATLRLGQSLQLSAQAFDAQGTVLGGAVSWRSANTAIALVTADGLVTAVSSGTVLITATAGGVNGMATITVSGEPVAVVSVAPTVLQRVPDQTSRLVAVLTDSAGRVLTDRVITWSSSDPSVALVDSTGMLTAGRVGTATVTAVCEGRTGTALVTVVAPTVTLSVATVVVAFEDSVQLVATIRDADGVVLTDRTPQWTSSDSAAVQVSPTGMVIGRSRGHPMASVVATSGGGQAAAAVTVALAFSSLTAGPMHTTCGIRRGGRAYCWGGNSVGALGDGTTISRAAPAAVSGGVLFSSLAAGAYHTCGLATSGVSYCWGAEQATGDGSINTPLTPSRVLLSDSVEFTALTSGGGYSCGLSTSGRALCWGLNAEGQLGSGTMIDASLPIPVDGGELFVALASNWDHTCGITTTGETRCWGSNRLGALGDSTRVSRAGPVSVWSPVRFVALSTGLWYNVCGVDAGGRAYCWGDNGGGQIGDGSLRDRLVPTAVTGGLRFRSLVGGDQFTCGLTTDDVAYCWGRNASGQLGDSSIVSRSIPAAVVGGRRFRQLVAGGQHACGLSSEGFAYCWGANAAGQLGDGEPPGGHRLAPVLVR